MYRRYGNETSLCVKHSRAASKARAEKGKLPLKEADFLSVRFFAPQRCSGQAVGCGHLM